MFLPPQKKPILTVVTRCLNKLAKKQAEILVVVLVVGLLRLLETK